MKIRPFKLERYYTLHEFTAQYSLCNSDCEAMSIGELLAMEDGAQEQFNNLGLGYTETKGHPELRRDIAATYQIISEEDILVCSGAQEPIFLFSQAILSTGDEVIVQMPCYQSVHSIPESMGCKVKNWMVRYINGRPAFDLVELEKMITNKTKVIYINTPHNPTGFHFSKVEQEALIAIARKYGVIIFSDEVYRELEHQPQYAIPGFGDAYENGVSLGVMSKAYGLPGLRIGWLATQNKEIIEKVAILKEYTTICNSGPSEFLAGVGLRNRQNLLERNLTIIKHNLPLYDAFFAKYGDLFSWFRPNAGPIAFVKMNFSTDDMLFADRALKEAKVLLLPGGIYDYPGFFRIGFGREAIPEALAVFDQFVQDSLVVK